MKNESIITARIKQGVVCLWFIYFVRGQLPLTGLIFVSQTEPVYACLRDESRQIFVPYIDSCHLTYDDFDPTAGVTPRSLLMIASKKYLEQNVS